MSDFADYVAPVQRRSIVTYLAAAPGFELNEGLVIGLLDQAGIPLSRSSLRAMIEWLKEREIVTVRDPEMQVHAGVDPVISLTPLGVDIAAGKEQCAGIQRPSHAQMERIRRIIAGLED